MSISRVVVLLNGAAGRGSGDPELRDAVEAACAAASLDAEVVEVDPREMPSAIGSLWARDPRPDAIVVAGGDGTVGCAAGAVAGTDVVLGVLPRHVQPLRQGRRHPHRPRRGGAGPDRR